MSRHGTIDSPSGLAGTQPPLLHPPYASTMRRAPAEPSIRLPPALADLEVPIYGWWPIGETDNDLTRQHPGEPIGERIIVAGRLVDEDGRPVAGALVEIWQANAAGRYRHGNDTHPAPLDPNFTGAGRTVTDAEGRYTFTTIKPGAYPWRNHGDAWRPAHIHFSIFGSVFRTRLVTQMYFPGDPLLAGDPIFQSIRDERARNRLVSRLDPALTRPGYALGFAFDIVLRGRDATPFEERT
ncbi:MAG TPA: protocatechuate 3,4-dioxygenase subunit beta [Vicinamibacterales bacterium]|nr:protocatechuate 3,4-dioxygenase subunit beta [Vicinamibacterales bacterium]